MILRSAGPLKARCGLRRPLLRTLLNSLHLRSGNISRFSSANSDHQAEWETVIGLEIHAQLKTRCKLFSRSLASWEEEPNSQIVPFDAAFPGTLPVSRRGHVGAIERSSCPDHVQVLNKDAVRLTLLTALALDCKIVRTSRLLRTLLRS